MTFVKKTWKEDGTTPITAAELNRVETGIDDLKIIQDSNAQGKYTKFPDGTLICLYDTTRTDIGCGSAYGSLFQGTFQWIFPFAFISPPVVTIGLCKWGSGASWGSVDATSTTDVLLRIMDVSARLSGTATVIKAMAVGRWK